MGLKGNLSAVNLADVFQVLSHGHSSGLLRVQAPEGTRFIEIEEGAISIVARSNHRILLGDLLLAQGVISEEDLQAALNNQEQTGQLLGSTLMEMGLVAQDDIESAVRFQVEEEICDLFLLKEGEIDFLANAKLDAKMALAGGFMRLKIDPNGVLLEAAKRVDDWQGILGRIPNQAMVFELGESGQEMLDSGEGLSQEGMIILKLIQESRTVDAMVLKGCLGRINTNNMLIELWDAELIRPASIESYADIAKEHKEQGRLEEARRVSTYGLQLSPSSKNRERFQTLLDELNSKAGTSGIQPGPVRLRSEVIRRKHPGLLVQRERSPAIWVTGGLLVLLALCGVGFYFLFYQGGQGNTAEIKQVERVIQRIDTLMREKKYNEALAEFNIPFSNPRAKERVDNKYKDTLEQIKSETVKFLNEFDQALESRSEEKISPRIPAFMSFREIKNFTRPLNDRIQDSGDRLRAWQEAQQFEEYVRQFDAIKAEKKGEALLDALEAFLLKDPAEELSAQIRTVLTDLMTEKLRAERAMAAAEKFESAGDPVMAMVRYKDAAKIFEGSKLTEKALARDAELTARQAQVLQRIQKIKMMAIQKNFDSARKELELFFKETPDSEFVKMARNAQLQIPENEAEREAHAERKAIEELRERGQEQEAQKKTLEFINKFPYAPALDKLTVCVRLECLPEAVSVMVEGKKVSAKSPVDLELPAVGMARVTLSASGFYDYEFSLKATQQGPVKVVMSRIPGVGPIRVPHSASDGLCIRDGYVALVNKNKVAFWRADLAKNQPLVRIQRGIWDKNSKVPPLHHPVFLLSSKHDELEFVVPTDQSRIWRMNPKSGKSNSIGLDSNPLTEPVFMHYPQVSEKKFIGIATVAGFECLEIPDGDPRYKPLKIGDEPSAAGLGIAHASGESPKILFIPRDKGRLHAIDAESGKLVWDVSMSENPIAPVVCTVDGSLVGIASKSGKVVIWDGAGGEKKWEVELGGTIGTGLVATPQGFVAITTNGDLTLLNPAAKDAASARTWTQKLGPGIDLQPAVLGSYLMVIRGKTILAINLNTGQLMWETPLTSPVVAIAVVESKAYLSTADSYLWIFDAE